MKNDFVDLRPYLPQLSISERNRRWAEVWTEMGLNDLDCLLLIGNDRFFGMGNSNIRYLTQISGQRMGAVAIFPMEGKPIVFGTPPHMHDKPFPVYKAFNDWIEETRALRGLKPVVETLKALGYEGSSIGLVGFKGAFRSSTIAYEEYEFLTEELPRARFRDATPILDRLRMIKSAEEIEMLKKSGHIARLKLDSMIAMARPGVKECELYAEMVKTEISQGGEAFIFNLLASGSVVDGEHIQHLLHGRGQPLSPTTRPLQEGDIVMTEFHTSYAGYLTACEKTVFLGKPPDRLKKIHDVCVECLDRGIEKLRPGITLTEAVSAFREPAKRARMDYVELGFHGHGLSSPEFPTVVYAPEAAGGKTEKDSEKAWTGVYGSGAIVLKENMVFGTNVEIHDPAWRSDVGIMGPGDTIWISAKGPVKLIGAPFEFTTV
jgi:Xaa-Pro aminopeptidase